MLDYAGDQLDNNPSDHVLRSAEFVVSRSSQVQIHPEAIFKLSTSLASMANNENMGLDRWKKHPLHPKTRDQSAVDWIFLVDSLNYSFWSFEENPAKKYSVKYKGEFYTGYWALCAAVNRAVDEGVPILDPHYYSEISESNLHHILRTDTEGEMPLIKERMQSLHEIGTALIKKYKDTFVNCILEADGSSQKLLNLVLANFPSYRDEGLYDGQNVSFLKRAQILVADIWACFEGNGFGRFTDIDRLTVFADYRIPQVLNYFGAITYGPDLQTKLDSNNMFQNGEKEEMEIRAATIWVSELLLRELKKHFGTQPEKLHVNAVVLDHYLWDYRQLHSNDMPNIPFHKCRCIYY